MKTFSRLSRPSANFSYLAISCQLIVWAVFQRLTPFSSLCFHFIILFLFICHFFNGFVFPKGIYKGLSPLNLINHRRNIIDDSGGFVATAGKFLNLTQKYRINRLMFFYLFAKKARINYRWVCDRYKSNNEEYNFHNFIFYNKHNWIVDYYNLVCFSKYFRESTMTNNSTTKG